MTISTKFDEKLYDSTELVYVKETKELGEHLSKNGISVLYTYSQVFDWNGEQVTIRAKLIENFDDFVRWLKNEKFDHVGLYGIGKGIGGPLKVRFALLKGKFEPEVVKVPEVFEEKEVENELTDKPKRGRKSRK